MLRKISLWFALALLAVAFVFSQPLVEHLLTWFADHVLHLSPLGSAEEAAPLTKWVDAQLSGWPSVGRATGKLLMAVVFYLLSSVLPFRVQQATHPAVNLWKRKDYTADFDGLPVAEKFAETGRVDNRAAFRMAMCILAAALIN